MRRKDNMVTKGEDRKGCADCAGSNALSGECEECGRVWGNKAPRGVPRSSPCPVGGLRGHDWRELEPITGEGEKAIVCARCKQVLYEEEDEEFVSSWDALQAAFLSLCQQYDQMGKQLQFLSHVIGVMQKEQMEEIGA